MTVQELQESVAGIIDSRACSAEFFFMLRTNDGYVLKRPDIAEGAQAELSAEFILSIRSLIVTRDEISLLALTNADGRRDVIYQYDLDELPTQLQLLDTILAQDITEEFNPRTDSLRDLEAILVLIGDQDRQIAIYKHHYPVTLMQRASGFSITRPGTSNRFEKLDQDILRINSKFEFFSINGQCYILDLSNLEKFYGFKRAIQNVASRAIDRVHEAELIVDVTVLNTRLNDLSFCRKLARLINNSLVLGRVPNEKIIAFASTHPKLSGKFALSEDGTKFDLQTKVSQNLFLKLLNDDYLKSLLTETDYESLAKDSIEADVQPAGRVETTGDNVLHLVARVA
jgi:hypothetical protein